MASERWTEVRRLFEAAVELDVSQRSAWLRSACGDDDSLLAEVEELLAVDAAATRASPILDQGAVPAAAPAEGLVGTRIGAFRIRGVIGSGGMGTVFEAEQERPRRVVALKMLRFAFAAENSRRRFEYEAEILGRLHHPGIAQVYEAGTWSQAGLEQPYFAMELVQGARPLDVFVREQGLGRDEIVQLMRSLCDAVHYAHQRGVIHRDLKPANILIDDQGQPKVIDFGIARVTGADRDLATLQTETGQIVGTLAYMSPEQFEVDRDPQDIRVDVHALGVILFELLTGRLPYELSGLPLAAATEVLRRTPVPRPSAVAGASRGAIPPELDWIVLRAMDKDPERRYPSAHELAVDLVRFQRGEPVLAGPPSTAYRIRKFVQRNRLAVTAAAAVVLAVLGGGIASAIGWGRAVRAESVAEARRQEAEEMADSLWKVTQLQAEILASARGERTVSFADVIDRARAKFESIRIDNPNIEAALHNALGISYASIGQSDRARQEFETAAALLGKAQKPMQRVALALQNNYGDLLSATGKLDEAEKMLRESLAGHLEQYGPRNTSTAEVRVNLANVLYERGRYDEAIAQYEQALPVLAAGYGAQSRQALKGITGYGTTLQAAGRGEAAREVLRDALARCRQHLGGEDVDTLTAQNALASALLAGKEYDEAESLLEELVAIRSRVLTDGHPMTLRALNNLAVCHERQEEYRQAVAIYRRILATRQAAGGGRTAFDLVTRFNLGVALHFQDEADTVAEAETVLRDLLADAGKVFPADNWRLAVFREHHGICLRKLHRYAEAEKALLAAEGVLTAVLGPGNSRTRSCYEQLALLYEAWERPADASTWRAKR